MFLTLLFNLSFLGFIVSNIGREIPNTSSRITEERAQKNKSNLGITVYYQAYEYRIIWKGRGIRALCIYKKDYMAWFS